MSLPKRFVILLAEDEPADAHLVRTALAENDMLVDLRHVHDGREVLEYLRGQGTFSADSPSPNLILLDLNMPRMNGHECLALLKQDPDLRDIPVVILTTSGVDHDIADSYRLGAAGFITKPLEVADFIRAIGDLGNYWMSVVHLPGHSAKALS